MRISTMVAASLVGLSACLPVRAVQIVQVDDGGNLVDTSLSSAQELAVDVGFVGDAPVRLQFRFEASETQVRFSSIVKELRDGRALAPLRLDFGGLSVQPGSVFDLALQPLGRALVDQGNGRLVLELSSATTEVYLGDALLRGDRPWLVASALPFDDRIQTLTISVVPEPQTWALWLAGLLPLLRRARGTATRG